MATEMMIRTLLAEASNVTTRSYRADDLDDAVSLFSRDFGGTDDAVLAEAFDRWLRSYGDKNPQALPTPAQIWAHHKALAGLTRQETTAREFQRPRPEFVEAHMAAIASIKRIGKQGQARSRHEHVEPVFDPATTEMITTGREDCPACAEIEERQQQITGILEKLPEPLSGSTRPCRCDGSGWIADKASQARREAENGWALDVYPCPTCRPKQFHEWRAPAGDDAA